MISERRPGINEFLSFEKYSLKSGVLLVNGSSRSAIYNINTGNIYSLNKHATKILTGQTKDEVFWKKLTNMGLAALNQENRKSVLPELLQKPSLQFVWFEIVSNDCNESCIHCYAECMPPTYRKGLGLEVGPKQEKDKKISFEKWKQLIDGAHSLGCKRCQFIGGEPFLYRGASNETVLDLAEYARNIGYEFIEIFTNGTLLTDKKIQRIKELDLNVAISLYSNDEKTHDLITKTTGSYKKTIEALRLLKRANIPVRVETVLMGPNEQSIEETQKFVEEMGFSHKQPDVLRQKGRGDNPSIMPTKESVVKYSLMLLPNFTITKDNFSRNISGHSCLLGKITITDNGDVLPCIFSRNLTVGNVQKTTIKDIISGQKLETVWKSTKDSVLVCQDCEYRYACFDCRPLSEGANRGKGKYLTAPYPRCNPNCLPACNPNTLPKICGPTMGAPRPPKPPGPN